MSLGKTSEIDKIAPALVQVLPRMKAEKDGKNPHFRSDYMTLDGILNSVKPILAEVNIGVMQTIETNDRDVTCTTILLHDSGQVMTGTATVHADKDTPQGFGSAITYARRYGIASLLGIADCEDDDGNKAANTNGTQLTLQYTENGSIEGGVEMVERAVRDCKAYTEHRVTPVR